MTFTMRTTALNAWRKVPRGPLCLRTAACLRRRRALDEKDKQLLEKEAELRRMQEMVAAMQGSRSSSNKLFI